MEIDLAGWMWNPGIISPFVAIPTGLGKSQILDIRAVRAGILEIQRQSAGPSLGLTGASGQIYGFHRK